MKEIVTKNNHKFMESNVTPSVKRVIKELCHRLYDLNNKQVTYIEIGIWYGGTFKEIKDAKNKLFEIKSLINKGIKFDNNIKYVNMKSPKGVNSSEVK